MPQLTEINIEVKAEEPSSLTFLLLQTHLSTLMTNPTIVSAQSIDKISFELYQQYLQIKNQQHKNQAHSNTMLSECNNIIQNYKTNQEALIEVSQDRLRLVKELKQATDEALTLMNQNEKLKKMVSLLSEMNQSLTSQNDNMKTQFASLINQKQQHSSSIQGLSDDYKDILSTNEVMKKELNDLSSLCQKFEEMSLPIRMIRVAFNSNSNLRELVLKQAEKQLGQNEQLRTLFKECTFELGSVQNK